MKTRFFRFSAFGLVLLLGCSFTLISGCALMQHRGAAPAASTTTVQEDETDHNETENESGDPPREREADHGGERDGD